MTSALTFLAPIAPERRASLDETLAEIAADLAGNRFIPFSKLATTHFARLVILPPASPSAPALLVFESNHDGEPDGYLDLLARVCGSGLDAIFGCCDGWPRRGVADLDGYAAFMRAHLRPASAFHQGYRDCSKASVENDLAVFAAIERWLDEAEPRRRELANRSALWLRERIARDVAASHPHLSFAPKKSDPHELVMALAIIILFLPVVLAYLVFALLLLRSEARDPADGPGDPPLPFERIDTLSANEDRAGVVQNQLTHLVAIKPGRVRGAALRFFLGAIALASRFVYNQGHLGSISSIHFARWVILDDRRLLFLSSYDGSWESYLGDFIDRASIGLSAVWSHTDRFPRTRGLLFGGATDEEAFKRWTRDHQVLTQVWYSSYPRFSIDNIRNAIAVREGLCAPLDETESRAWLARL
jgi:hypothetical protein